MESQKDGWIFRYHIDFAQKSTVTKFLKQIPHDSLQIDIVNNAIFKIISYFIRSSYEYLLLKETPR